ncbi:tetratricopeptide repeat protein [Sungkyunkwania multivorans]|uniref:Tetratricopeptide repeat protein n=1 Tax=Sungkyunkwania multivorans TaxID=1173618 RepID=A0ABW3CZ35_9FLAO
MKTDFLLIIRNLFIAIFGMLCYAVIAQDDISQADWQQDLRYLQKTIHTDYPFLFKKTTPEEFDAEVEKLYAAIPTMQPHEIQVGFTRIISSFKYGHTTVGFRDAPIKYHQLPMNIYQFNDGLYIEGVHKDYKETLGAKVIAVEGKPIAEVLKAVYPVIPAENSQFFNAYGIGYSTIPEVLHAQGVTENLKDDITLTLEKNGNTFKKKFKPILAGQVPREYGVIKQDDTWLSARDMTDVPFYLKHLERIYYYEYLPEHKAVYVRHSQIQDDPSEDIPSFYAKVFDFIDKNEVEKLIIDVRLNGGGNNYKNKPVITGIIATEKINQVGKLFVIIGRRTFSACQNLINELDNYTNAIFVGEPSAENINFYGDNRKVTLPKSKLQVYLSFAWWQDKPQWENADWTAPHLAVDMSFDEYRNNEDPVLAAALNFADDNFITDPMRHLTNLFMAGKMEEVASEATRMVKDPQYKFFDFEGEFNKAAYRMMGTGQMDGAMYVFQMNASLFPDSANVWDSLAEVHWKANNIEKAKEYYNKALQMDPDGVGKNAKEMLQKIAQQGQ